MGFVPGRCLQGHGELGQIPTKDPFILLILLEDPQENPQPRGVPGVGPTAEQLQSLQEALGRTSEPNPGTCGAFIPSVRYWIFLEAPNLSELPGQGQEGLRSTMEGAAGWKEGKDGRSSRMEGAAG